MIEDKVGYKAERTYLFQKYAMKSVKPCWIAHAKRLLGLTVRIAHNRIDPEKGKYDCPPNHLEKVKEAVLFVHEGRDIRHKTV